MTAPTLFPTTLVGSYPQPSWLVDKEQLARRVPRIRDHDLWRVPAAQLQEAMEDATRVVIRAQETLGIDIVTDGEVRRESYSNRFATALEGIDQDNPKTVKGRNGLPNLVPRIVGKIRRTRPVELEDLLFLKANTDRQVKITVPGPFTMLQQAWNEYYPSEADAAMDYAQALNEEIRDLFAHGADVVQIDEPYMQASPDKAREYGVKALNHALAGQVGTTAVHICFGYAALVQNRPSGYDFLPELAACNCQQVSIETAQSQLDCSILTTLPNKKIMVGCLDLSDMTVETPEVIVDRIRKALQYIAPEQVILAPDCGMKYLPRDVAYGKLASMVEAARVLRQEYGAAR